MANRNRIRKGDNLDPQKQSIPHKLLSSNRTQNIDKSDDLIVILSEAYENRRARQVGEWERLYDQNVYSAF